MDAARLSQIAPVLEVERDRPARSPLRSRDTDPRGPTAWAIIPKKTHAMTERGLRGGELFEAPKKYFFYKVLTLVDVSC